MSRGFSLTFHLLFMIVWLHGIDLQRHQQPLQCPPQQACRVFSRGGLKLLNFIQDSEHKIFIYM
jgi:hypothetical protein